MSTTTKVVRDRPQRNCLAPVLLLILLLFPGSQPTIHAKKPTDKFDVVIAGGSTAAFAAAVSAAESGAKVALLEPTDWIGGQLTSSGVPAVDEAWHKLVDDTGKVTMDVAKIARTPANISPHLHRMLNATGCPGNCWVSRFCFEPIDFLDTHLVPLERSLPNLTVFRETVVKQVATSDDRITGLTAIKRTFKLGKARDAYDRLPSAEIVDWYSAEESSRFSKTTISFRGENLVFVDATEWGELLALSNAPHLIGVEHVDGGLAGDDTFGQSITFGFVQEFNAVANPARDAEVPNPPAKHLGFGDYRDRKDAWDQVWRYRRIRSSERKTSVGDLCLQNWGYYVEKDEGGNDYPFGYVFLGREATKKQARENWRGGVDLEVMAAAEQRAYAWHNWFKTQTPKEIGADRISLNRKALGASHGLSMLPYIRDTRRSIGIEQFVLKTSDLEPTAAGKLAKRFDDRIALGAYPVDIHPMADRDYPAYVDREYDIAPFTIPYRALTNDRFGNLLVAGKTMAQSFLANSATRLHPTEWSTGTAAGVAAAKMARERKSSRDLQKEISELQKLIAEKTPIDWTIE